MITELINAGQVDHEHFPLLSSRIWAYCAGYTVSLIYWVLVYLPLLRDHMERGAQGYRSLAGFILHQASCKQTETESLWFIVGRHYRKAYVVNPNSRPPYQQCDEMNTNRTKSLILPTCMNCALASRHR